MKLNRYLKTIILITCICGIVYFSYNIVNYFIEENASNDLNEELKNVAVTTNIDYEQEQNNKMEEQDNKNTPIEINFDILKQKNSDIIGWIYMENSKIDFPVVQSKDNEYYLRRLIDGSYNRAGTIFMDYRNSKDLLDGITIIYGHNMKNNTMFSSLLNFKEQSYYDEHKKLYYFTENIKYEIDLIAGYTENADSIVYQYPYNERYRNDIIRNAIKNSTFKSDIESMPEDKIIVLSTCSYEYEEARYVLIGIIKEIK